MNVALLLVTCGLFVLVASQWITFSTGWTFGDRPARPSVHPQIVISLVVLAAALYIIVFKADASDATQKWAIGAVGTLLGFWLKRS